MPRAERILAEHGADGFFMDLGYPLRSEPELLGPPVPCYGADDSEGHVSPCRESAEHDAALEDMLCLILGMVHRYNGIVSLHHGMTEKVEARVQVYDYVLVGEAQQDLDRVRGVVHDWTPYVLLLADMSRARILDEQELYLQSIPYMQFPWRVDGRPLTGERAVAPGFEYGDDFWTRNLRCQREHYRSHPEGPYAYSLWDSCPPDAKRHETWEHYFRLYRPMVSPSSRAWIDLDMGESKFFEMSGSAELTASLFVNEDTYLVLANYGGNPATVNTRRRWQDRESDRQGTKWTIRGRKVVFLRRLDENEHGRE